MALSIFSVMVIFVVGFVVIKIFKVIFTFFEEVKEPNVFPVLIIILLVLGCFLAR